jgi:hypothetical protein
VARADTENKLWNSTSRILVKVPAKVIVVIVGKNTQGHIISVIVITT